MPYWALQKVQLLIQSSELTKKKPKSIILTEEEMPANLQKSAMHMIYSKIQINVHTMIKLVTASNGNIVFLRFTSVLFIAVNQCLVTACMSLSILSPIFARRGLVASIAAHATWNFLGCTIFPFVTLPLTRFPNGRRLLEEFSVCNIVLQQMVLKNAGVT